MTIILPFPDATGRRARRRGKPSGALRARVAAFVTSSRDDAKPARGEPAFRRSREVEARVAGAEA